MALRDFIRKNTPQFVLNWLRERKKEKLRADLAQKQKQGNYFTEDFLLTQLQKIGIKPGDHLMVHSAMSKIGILQDGPKTLVNALFNAVGDAGTICMPSSPVKTLQFEHMQNAPVFDVKNTPSAMGAITEYFRKLPRTRRSLHPTEPVCANGFLAAEFVKDHFGERTAYTQNSPWKKLMAAKGKILYIGVTLDNAGTHLHTLEDAVDFKYPVYAAQEFDAVCIDERGEKRVMKTKVHNPEFSKRRKCDELIPLFEEKGALTKCKLGDADCLILDAEKMFAVMMEAYKNKKITMYSPHGEKITGYDE